MVDLKRQYLHLKAQIEAAVNGVMEDTRFILGPNVVALEQEIAAYHQVPHAVGVANGTDAIRLSLKACGIGAGDEVLTTPFTFISVAEVLLEVGATPVFVDVNADTFTMDTERIEACVTDRTKAIVPVHLFGHPEQMDIIMDIAERNDLKVIEDCAQAFGSTFDGQMVGTFGHCGCYSFYPSKNLGCYGDGGMVITKDYDTADQIRMLRNHGSNKP
jgi:dTDP-4-amino-4,6-dideoxygalactose transaminase